MKRLYLIRHGHTVDNMNMCYSGFSDCELSEFGLKQVEALTEYMKDIKVDKIYSSSLRRSVNTISPTAKNLGMEVVGVEGLRELNFGDFDGMKFVEMRDNFPDEFEKLKTEGDKYVFPNGESLIQMFERNIDAFEAIKKETEDIDDVVICSHMGTIRNLLSYIFSGGVDMHWNFRVENATVTVIEFNGDFPVMSMMGIIPYEKELLKPIIIDEDMK